MTPLPNPGKTAESLISRLGPVPEFAIVLGSGFATVLDSITPQATVAMAELPGFPPVQAAGHIPAIIAAKVADLPVWVLAGRAHFYEGLTMSAVTFPTRVLAAAGVRAMLLTNAAGAINETFRPGEFMLIEDHINFMGANPLSGDLSGAAKHVDLSHPYDLELRNCLREAAQTEGISLRSGVYLAVSGPCYETPAEIRAFRTLGADAVGMSTVPEVIVARQCGLRVAAISCLTNMAAGISTKELSHEDVLACGRTAAGDAAHLLSAFLRQRHQP